MSLSILVVETDGEIRWLLADLLKRRGYEVVTFEDDHEVLAYLHDVPPRQCIVLDSRTASRCRALEQRLHDGRWTLVVPGRPLRIDDVCGQLERLSSEETAAIASARSRPLPRDA